MRLSAPKKAVFAISLCLIFIGLIASLTPIPVLTDVNHWISFAGGGLLTLGCLLKGF